MKSRHLTGLILPLSILTFTATQAFTLGSESDRGSSDRGSSDRGSSDRGSSDRASSDRASSDRASSDRGSSDRGATGHAARETGTKTDGSREPSAARRDPDHDRQHPRHPPHVRHPEGPDHAPSGPKAGPTGVLRSAIDPEGPQRGSLEQRRRYEPWGDCSKIEAPPFARVVPTNEGCLVIFSKSGLPHTGDPAESAP